MLIQPQYQPMSVADQTMQIYLAVKGYLMPVQVHEVPEFEDGFVKFMHTNYPEVGQHIEEQKVLSPEDEKVLQKAVGEYTKQYGATHELVKEEE